MVVQQDLRGESLLDGFRKALVLSSVPHPLEWLSVIEIETARKAILEARGKEIVIKFRGIFLDEPPKQELIKFLDTEHAAGIKSHTPRPARLAKVQYDLIHANRTPEYTESIVDVNTGIEVSKRVVSKTHQPSLGM